MAEYSPAGLVRLIGRDGTTFQPERRPVVVVNASAICRLIAGDRAVGHFEGAGIAYSAAFAPCAVHRDRATKDRHRGAWLSEYAPSYAPRVVHRDRATVDRHR